MRGDAPLLAAAASGAAALLLALGAGGRLSPVVTEALRVALPVSLAAGGCTFGILLGGLGPGAPALSFAASLGAAAAAAASLLFACGTAGQAEVGWRRPAFWAAGVLLASALPAATALLFRSLPARDRPFAAALPAALALLAWVPPYVLESRRVRRELTEEVGLGILPAGDPLVLALPWRRLRERRFGRADEKREYVRSALLLAVARSQQRRRSGDAVRLRQLEVLAFRTRVRRAANVHLERAARASAPADPDVT